jgi:hypothetical protein
MNLSVTPADLRIGQGYVRCGRCSRVFNALLSLAEDPDHDEPSGLAATGTTTVPALQDTGDEETLAEELAEAEPATTAQPATTATHEVDVVERQPTGTFETIVLEGDGYLQTEEHVDEKEVDEQLRDMALQIDASNPILPAEDIVLETDTTGSVPGPDADPDPAVDNPRRQHRAWWVVASVLGLALLAQFVHHSRQALVAQPWLERPMRSLYAMFGTTLEPAWDVNAYDLRQLGGEAPPGTGERIVLRAAVHNHSPHSQPTPLIQVTLQDRFGNVISTTAIAPADYLRNAPARMAPDQRLDATLNLSDPERKAEGFELDTCLAAAGQLHCSHDR